MKNSSARSLKTKSILLRYFNPVGAHPSIAIGEMPVGKPDNLFPGITQTAIGRIPKLFVHGEIYIEKSEKIQFFFELYKNL